MAVTRKGNGQEKRLKGHLLEGGDPARRVWHCGLLTGFKEEKEAGDRLGGKKKHIDLEGTTVASWAGGDSGSRL